MLYCISGKPHCGKSTFLKEIVKELNIKCYIITEEILNEKNERKGFKTIITEVINEKTLKLKSKEYVISSTEKETDINLGKYYINIDEINKIADKICKLYDKYDKIIIDEIASMQLLSFNYALAIQKILFTHDILNKKVIFTASVEINDKINPYIKLNVHLHKVKN